MKVEFRTCKHLGDCVCLSQALRNLKRARPDIEAFVSSNYPDVFSGVDYCKPHAGQECERLIKAGYTGSGGNHNTGNHGNLPEGILFDIAAQLGVENVQNFYSKPILACDSAISTHAGCIIVNSNCQECSSCKGYPHWNKVCEALAAHREVVLIGGREARDIREIITAQVTDLRGKTTHRELFQLVRDAACIVSPASGIIHVANAFDTPSVILIGANEPEVLTRYERSVRISSECHGLKNYSREWGCRHFRTTSTKSCEHIVDIGPRHYAKCMVDIQPEDVCAEVLKQIVKFER